MSITELHNKIDELYDAYKDDNIIVQKLNNYIINELPTILSNTKQSIINRKNRKLLLQEAHDIFVKQFINNNKYFYCNTSEIFFIYDHEHYSTIREDTIIHTILSALRLREDLLPWKFKIKTSIIKNIKDISILNSLPESNTIQNVQNIFINIFETKNEIKYFLTILGDIVLKKNNNNINIISNNLKNLLRIIENISSQYFGHSSIVNQFKFKYCDHNYNDCRILVANNCPEVEETIFKSIIDIIIVSCYYSNRFSNSDNFLELSHDKEFVDRILFLKNNTQDEILKKFIDSKIQTSDNASISMKNMLYLWKLYLEELKLPFIISNVNIKILLKKILKYDEESENFIDCTSNKIPFVSKFLNFWDETIVDDPHEYYIEIDEICILFKNYTGLNNKNIYINEESILNIIKHFYPDTNIDGKYICGITCNQWNKQNDIVEFINKKYNDAVKAQELDKKFSLYELYNDYSRNYCKKNKNLIVISKTYFDLFLCNILSTYSQNIDLNMLSLSLFANY
jgi:hypothetical protein